MVRFVTIILAFLALINKYFFTDFAVFSGRKEPIFFPPGGEKGADWQKILPENFRFSVKGIVTRNDTLVLPDTPLLF
jgi:hypothetical protein